MRIAPVLIRFFQPCVGTNRKLINHKVGRFLNFIRSNGDSKGFVHTIKQILNEKGEINNHG